MILLDILAYILIWAAIDMASHKKIEAFNRYWWVAVILITTAGLILKYN